MTLNTTKTKVLYLCVTNVPESQILLLFRSTTSCFGVRGHVETSAPNDPKMTLNTTRSRISHSGTSVQVSNFSPCCSMASHFRFVGQLSEISALNGPKMTLCTIMSKAYHMCVTSVPESQISVHFAL